MATYLTIFELVLYLTGNIKEIKPCKAPIPDCVVIVYKSKRENTVKKERVEEIRELVQVLRDEADGKLNQNDYPANFHSKLRYALLELLDEVK